MNLVYWNLDEKKYMCQMVRFDTLTEAIAHAQAQGEPFEIETANLPPQQPTKENPSVARVHWLEDTIRASCGWHSIYQGVWMGPFKTIDLAAAGFLLNGITVSILSIEIDPLSKDKIADLFATSLSTSTLIELSPTNLRRLLANQRTTRSEP